MSKKHKYKIILTTASGVSYDITIISSEIRVSGAEKQCSRVLDFKTLKPKVNKTLPGINVNLGDTITVMEDSKKVFVGVVWDKEVQNNSIDVDLTCYDKSIYLNKSESKTQVYTNKTADAIGKAICSELGLKIGKFAKGSKVTVNGRNMKAYDIIMAAYSKTSEMNKKQYKLTTVGEEVVVFESGEKHNVVIEEMKNDDVGKLISLSYKASLDDVINKVEEIDETNKDKKKTKAEDKESQKLYGLVQKVVRNQKVNINSVMSKAKIEADVEVMGDWDMITGKKIKLKAKDLSGEFYITKDEHEYKDGVHTVKMTLSNEYEMDKKDDEKGKSEGKSKKRGGKAVGSKSSNAALNYAKSKIGMRYSQGRRDQEGYYDCSSLVKRSYQSLGLLPTKNYDLTTRTIAKDSHFVQINKSELRPGDVAWVSGHMALYAGNGKTVEAMNPSMGVRQGNLGSRFTRFYRVKGS